MGHVKRTVIKRRLVAFKKKKSVYGKVCLKMKM